MKIRDLVEAVRPDHLITLYVDEQRNLARGEDTIRMKCSCRWETSYLIHPKDIDLGYYDILQRAWVQSEHLNHLLDQEIDKEALS